MSITSQLFSAITLVIGECGALTSSIMVSMASDNSSLVEPLATMFLSLRQYSLNYKTNIKENLSIPKDVAPKYVQHMVYT